MPDYGSNKENSDAAAQNEAVVVDYEQSEEVQRMLKVSPFALPLPVEVLKDNRVKVTDIPEGHLLNGYAGDLDVRVSATSPLAKPRGLNAYRKAPRSERSASEWSNGEKEASLVTTPLPSTNEGRNPDSRRFIRGVLHTRPLQLRLGALATFLILWLVPAGVVSAVLLIFSAEIPGKFEWVSPHMIWVPVALVLVGLFYLIFGLSSKCCVCNQKLFIYRSTLKSEKAHHLPGFGYVLPLCVHLIFFGWFRCAHCGTPLRLKK